MGVSVGVPHFAAWAHALGEVTVQRCAVGLLLFGQDSRPVGGILPFRDEILGEEAVKPPLAPFPAPTRTSTLSCADALSVYSVYSVVCLAV